MNADPYRALWVAAYDTFTLACVIGVALTVIGCLIAAWRHKRPMASYTRCGRFPP